MSAYTHHGDCSTSDPCLRCKEFGESTERERIIKLLEPLGCPENGVEHDCQNGLGYTTAADLIALIKGENKPFITTKQAEELTNEMLEE